MQEGQVGVQIAEEHLNMAGEMLCVRRVRLEINKTDYSKDLQSQTISQPLALFS